MTIFFVIVLYRCSIENSSACKSLLTSRFPAGVAVAGVIFDNTPGLPQIVDHVQPGVVYRAAGDNIGLPAAYNFALKQASEIQADYLLLLDQDSEVTTEFLEAAVNALNRRSDCEVAWVPSVFASNKIVSPYRLSLMGTRSFGFKKNAYARRYFAINSCSVILVDFLLLINGFDEHYWLDALDSAFYSRVARESRQVGEIDFQVTHQLSLLEDGMPAWRLINIARYEACYCWEWLNPMQAVTGTLRILLRGLLRGGALAREKCFSEYIRAVLSGTMEGLSRRSDAAICDS